MLLLAAFTQGRRDLLGAALEDRIHQPYRSSLCPLLPALKPLAGQSGILGVVLSGAGPSVLLFLDLSVRFAVALSRVQSQLRDQGLNAELLSTSISSQGVTSGRP
jgi:homoserine kinase